MLINQLPKVTWLENKGCVHIKLQISSNYFVVLDELVSGFIACTIIFKHSENKLSFDIIVHENAIIKNRIL
jgi:hypothetical protein